MMKTNRFTLQMRMLVVLLCLQLFASPSHAAEELTAEQLTDLNTIYQTTSTKLSLQHTGEMAKRLEAMAWQQARFLSGQLKPFEKIPGALSLTDSRSNEHGIRPNARTALGMAILATYSDAPENYGFDADKARSDAIAMIRFMAETHGAGGEVCADGKQWKGQWQSALWANSAGTGAWIIWDALDQRMKYLVARMICDEADRFINVDPPVQVKHDSKAEENAWNSSVITLAHAMFPHHPRHEDYGHASRKWMFNSFSREIDLTSAKEYDGKPLSEWLVGATIHNDYSLENHDRVHPDYGTTFRKAAASWIVSAMAGLQPSEAIDYNSGGMYEITKFLTLRDGGFIYPNGQDWQLHRNCQWVSCHIIRAVMHNDPVAGRLAMVCLETGEKMLARDPQWGAFQPDEFSFPSTQMDTLVYFTRGWLLLRYRGDPEMASEEEAWEALEGRRLFEYGMFIVDRSEKGTASFSYGNRLMGMVIPASSDLLVSPNERSMIGAAYLDGKSDRPLLKDVTITTASDRVTVTGEVDRLNGLARQSFQFTSLNDGRVVYADKWDTKSTTHSVRIDQGLMAVLNNKNWVYHDGSRSLFWDNGEVLSDVTATDSASPRKFSSRWINVDNKLGIVQIESGNSWFDDNRTQGNGRLEQQLILNRVEPEAEKQNTSGIVAVYYPLQSKLETNEAARLVQINGNALKLDANTEVVLSDGVLTIEP